MAFVTLCPQCQTGFSVQPEHFSMADGWVRCGQCAHVFQLDQHLFEMDDPQPVLEMVQPLSRPASLTSTYSSQSDEPLRGAWVCVVLMFFLLIMQWAFYHRHAIAGRVPELQPVLQWLCQPFSCDIDWPKDPDHVSLESSSFKRADQDTFVFEAVVKNLGDSVLSPPALELTLHAEGRDVVRRVIMPHEWGLNEALRPHGSHPLFFSFRLDPTLSSSIDGFKALLFYP
ncbi:MAG: zinc-ribbon and DUF3426 domain-containing protein [Limnohabitans sp.]